MFQALFNTWLWIRDKFSKAGNAGYDVFIETDLDAQEYIKQIIKSIYYLSTTDEVKAMYYKIYQGYQSDPLDGIIDWSPSFSTAIVKKTEDCDGSSVVWKNLAQKYCDSIGVILKSVACTAFFYPSFDNIGNSHVMCVADTDKGLLLFDYSHIAFYDSWDEIRLYYYSNYCATSIFYDYHNILTATLPDYDNVDLPIMTFTPSNNNPVTSSSSSSFGSF